MKYYEDWTEFAVCRSVEPDLWFPEKGGRVADPVAVCNTCSVRLLCLEKAMRDELGKHRQFRMGIWGGLTPRARVLYEPQWLAEQEEVTAA